MKKDETQIATKVKPRNGRVGEELAITGTHWPRSYRRMMDFPRLFNWVAASSKASAPATVSAQKTPRQPNAAMMSFP